LSESPEFERSMKNYVECVKKEYKAVDKNPANKEVYLTLE